MESEETSDSISWIEISGKGYTETSSKKAAYKGKAAAKAKGKNAVP